MFVFRDGNQPPGVLFSNISWPVKWWLNADYCNNDDDDDVFLQLLPSTLNEKTATSRYVWYIYLDLHENT